MTGTTQSAVDIAQTAFIGEIQKKGILHVFHWIDGYVSSAAKAQVADIITKIRSNYVGVESDLLDGVVEAALIDELMSAVGRINNHSTQQGANHMQQAYVSALAEAIDRAHSSTGTRKGLTLDLVNRTDRRNALLEAAHEAHKKNESE